MNINLAGAATYFNFIVRSDNGGLSGAYVAIRSDTIKVKAPTGSNFGCEFAMYTVQ